MISCAILVSNVSDADLSGLDKVHTAECLARPAFSHDAIAAKQPFRSVPENHPSGVQRNWAVDVFASSSLKTWATTLTDVRNIFNALFVYLLGVDYDEHSEVLAMLADFL